jgi:heptosyltransferase-1
VKVLIVKLSSIGDIVHTLPALAEIRRAFPSAEISWAVENRSAEILRDNPAIDRLIEIDTRALRGGGSVDEFMRNLRSQIGELRKGKYDIALDFQGLIKSAAIAKLSGARRRCGFAGRSLREPSSRVLLTDSVRVPKQTHVIRKNLLLASTALRFPLLDGRLEFPIGSQQADVAEAGEIVSRAGSRFAILNPAGGWPTKLWDAAKYGQLADRLFDKFGLKSVIVYGPGENDLANSVLSASHKNIAVATKPSLKGFYELAGRAAIYVGGDTGPTHLAIAAGTPVVGIFGPTEWWRNGSLRADDICVERTDIDCRENCHRRSCSNWICMDIDVERVFEAVGKRLAASSKNGDQ